MFAVGRGVPDFSDEEEDYSSGNDDGEGEGSDSEPMIDERRRGRKNKMNGNVRVSSLEFLVSFLFLKKSHIKPNVIKRLFLGCSKGT